MAGFRFPLSYYSFRFRAVCSSQHCALFGDYAIIMHAQIGGVLIHMSVSERGGEPFPSPPLMRWGHHSTQTLTE